MLTEAAAKPGRRLPPGRPYYNKPSQEGLFQHFKAVSKCARFDVALQHSRRCGSRLASIRCAASIASVPILWDQGGRRQRDRVSAMRVLLGHRFTILSGDDSLTLPSCPWADGVIAWLEPHPRRWPPWSKPPLGNGRRAETAPAILPMFRDLFIETNPCRSKPPGMMGQLQEEYRLPLVPLSRKTKKPCARRS